MEIVNGNFNQSPNGHKTMDFTLEHEGKSIEVLTVLDAEGDRWQVNSFKQGNEEWKKNKPFKDVLKERIGYK